MGVITGKSAHEEATVGTKSFDLVRAVESTQWSGLQACHDPVSASTKTWKELTQWAADRKEWRRKVYLVASSFKNEVKVLEYKSVYFPPHVICGS